jgi:hypothetical protein
MDTNLKSFAARQIEIVDNLYKFVGPCVTVEENSPMTLAHWQDPVGSKRYVARFNAGEGEGLNKQLTAVADFMTSQKFERVEENYREDIYVNSDGAVACLNLVEVPGITPEIMLAIQMPKTTEEAELVKAYYNIK